MTGLLAFFVLQALDIITTLCFSAIGVQEANPILTRLSPHIGMGLALFLVKCFAVAIAVFWYQRKRSLTPINILFGALIVWNIVAMALWQHCVRYCEACWS